MKIVARSFAAEFLPPATLFGPLGHTVERKLWLDALKARL